MSASSSPSATTTLPTNTTTTTFLTRSKLFQRLTKWAFSVCDVDGTGYIHKDELYAGILLVHLQLAKYTGSAACYPPTRAVIEQLFEASDDDNSGVIDETEFTQIMVICCAQIASRILVYYSFIILLVPRLASNLVGALLWSAESWGIPEYYQQQQQHAGGTASKMMEWVSGMISWGQIAEQAVCLALFFLVIPLFFNWIDRKSGRAATAYVVLPPGGSNKNSPADKKD